MSGSANADAGDGAVRPGCACIPSRGSPALAAQSAPRAWHRRVASSPVRVGPVPSEPADGASAAASPARGPRPARKGLGSSRVRAASARPGRPSPVLVSGSAAAAPRPLAGAPAARRPSKPTSAPAAPAIPSGGRTSDTAVIPSQARDPSSQTAIPAGSLADQLPMPGFGTPQGAGENPGYGPVPALFSKETQWYENRSNRCDRSGAPCQAAAVVSRLRHPRRRLRPQGSPSATSP